MALALVRGACEFVVGDDWPTALGIVVSLAVVALLAAFDVTAWWLMPLAVLALLRWSLLRRARSLLNVAPTIHPTVDAARRARPSKLR